MEQKLTLLLIGKTGSGKSFTGNSILDRRAFPVSSKVRSMTKEVQTEFGNFGNYILKIVDGPGLIDTDKDSVADQERAAADMAEILATCDGGVDAFLFVYRYGNKFTVEEKGVLDNLKNIFGENFYSHVIVVLTMGDLFRGDMEDEGNGNITFHHWCWQQDGPFKQLFYDCRGRFVLFKNKEKDENAMNKQRKKIIKLANQVQKIQGKYTSQAFQAAKELRERYIVEKKLPILTGQIQEKCGLLTADLEKYMKAPTEQDKLIIQESIAAVKKVIKDEDKGTNLLQHVLILAERVEDNLDNIDQLHKLTKELNDTRNSKIGWTGFGSFCAGVSGAVGAVGGVSLWTTLLTFTMPPVAVGAAIGTAVVSATATAINYLLASTQEQKLQEEQDTTNSKLEKAGVLRNSTK